MKSTDVLVDFLDFKIHIRKIPTEDCKYVVDQTKNMTSEERNLFVVTYCIKDFKDTFLLLDRMGATKQYGVDKLTFLLYKECLEVNPDLRLKEKEVGVGFRQSICGVCGISYLNHLEEHHKCFRKKEEKMRKFWMVVCYESTRGHQDSKMLGRSGPIVRHETKEFAEGEAKKLAGNSASRYSYVVLEALESYKLPPPEPTKFVKTVLSDWTEEG